MDRKEAKGIAYFCKLEGRVIEDAHREDFWENILKALAQPDIIHCKDCKHARESKDAFDFDDTPLCECNYMTQPNRWHEFCSWAERK